MSQFRVLYRDFLTRILDLELLSSRGDIERLLVQFAAMLGAFSFTFTCYFVPRYSHAKLSADLLARLAHVDQDLLISTTMAVAGLFTVLAWNTVLPDRRDCLILGLLPVRQRTIFFAKLAALATILGLSILAINSFTGLAYPFTAAAPDAGALTILRSLLAWWFTMIAAGAFVCCSLLGIQGLASQLMPYRLFLRLSSGLQLTAFFVILAGYILKPPFPHVWPSAWFLGLYLQLSGTADAHLTALAARGSLACLIAVPVAALTFGLAFRRNNRRIIEQPDIAPARRSRPFVQKLFPEPIDRAVIFFTARTIARSRHHRLLLAAYGGIGLAIALAYTRDLVYPSGSIERLWSHPQWNQPNAPLLAGSFILLFFAVIATRAVMSLPIALRANWIFRLTAIEEPAAYCAATRKALLILCAAPILLMCAAVFLSLWPLQPALQHLALLSVAAFVMTDLALYRFRKVPFACSYLPGKANLHVRLGIGAIAFIFLATQGVELEYWTLSHPTGYLILLGVLLLLAFLAYRRTATHPLSQLQFEEQPPEDIESLKLYDDGGPSLPPQNMPSVRPTSGSFATPVTSARIRTPQLFSQFPGSDPFDVPRAPFSLEQLARDLLGGVRILTRAPGFSAAAIAMIALGLGWNTTIYSIVNTILNKPAPVVEARSLVSFGVKRMGRPTDPGDNNYAEYVDYARTTSTMQQLAATVAERFNMILPDGSSYRMRGTLVTGNYLDTLRVGLFMGRQFTADEVSGAAPLAVIITYPVWQTQFQSAANVLGKTVTLNGYPATIIGVAPPHFHGATIAPNLEICVPVLAYARLQLAAGLDTKLEHGIGIIGRLADHASLSSAQVEFDSLTDRLRQAFPQLEGDKKMVLAHYSATAFGPNSGRQARVFLAIVMAVTLLTLVIVCANVANLMLARAISRQREIAIRLSMGASRARLLRMLFAEGLVLSGAAGAVAWLFASWATRALVSLLPHLESGALFDVDFTPDARVAVYAMLLALLSTLAFTMVPALRAWRQDLLPSLRTGEQAVIRGRSPLATGLTVGQLALCVMLLVGGGLAWRSLSLIDTADLGFNRDHVLLAGVNFSGLQTPGILTRVRQSLAALPGVTSVSWSIAAPPHSHPGMLQPAHAAGSSNTTETDITMAGPDYLHTLGVPFLAGRDFLPTDQDAAIVNHKLAAALWPNQPAIGQTFTVAGTKPFQVVGVVPDAAFNGVGFDGSFSGLSPAERRPFVFLSDRDAPLERTIHVRYTGDLAALVAALRMAIHQVDPRLAVFSVRTMEAEWRDFTAPIRAVTTLLALFALGSLVLASIGLYAVTSFYTARRTREFGIRMALGATPRQTLQAVFKEALLLTAAGLGIGLVICLAISSALTHLLFGITPTDIVTYAAVVISMSAVSLLASYLPARRASRIDPIESLRAD
jgi:predicted permease